MSGADHWPRRPGPLLDWLIGDGRGITATADLLAALVERMVESGIPLARMTLHVRTLHPLIAGERFLWRRGVDEVEVGFAEHGILASDTYGQSPIRLIYEDEVAAVHQRLDVEGALPFPIYEDLRAEGLTDYVALPCHFNDRRRAALTFATDRAGGFSSEDLSRIDDLVPALAPILEAQSTRRIAVNILNTYVGPRAGQQVLDGQIRRGDGETINAAIWFCDLRGFTGLSARYDRDTLIELLNTYFQAMAEPVARYGGETMKFIGDAMLAMFPMSQPNACVAALKASLEAREAMQAINAERVADGQDPLGFGIALHVGDVMYGNIGAPDRLDFTVIGPAMNIAERVQELCKSLGYEILATSTFAALAPLSYRRLGRYPLRGLAEPVTIYVPNELGERIARAVEPVGAEA